MAFTRHPAQRAGQSRRLVIYCRYSTDMQSPKSCEDQEREVREGLDRLGIPHTHAVVIYDRAESGTKSDRDGFERISGMIARKEVAMLAVDDQARLSRANNAFSFIQDLVYANGRFISTGEGIDTTQQGWELRVKVMEMHNSVSISELARRVHRGQEGRVLSNLTAGDYPYGYESFLVNPEAANSSKRGPKPEKNVRILEEHAVWVRQIFAWFLAGDSMAKIAAKLTATGAPLGSRAQVTLDHNPGPQDGWQPKIHWPVALGAHQDRPQLAGQNEEGKHAGERPGMGRPPGSQDC